MFNFKTLEIMKLENLNLVELNAQEVQEVDGGFIPLVICGVYFSAKVVACAMGAAAIAGTACGIAVFAK
jgi:lactobin A/cerein 7B family class IIb bacteriocin